MRSFESCTAFESSKAFKVMQTVRGAGCARMPHRSRHSVFPSDILDGFRGILASTVKVSAGASLGNTTVRNLGSQACARHGRFGSIFQEPSAARLRTNA